jgi:hypothetical protein
MSEEPTKAVEVSKGPSPVAPEKAVEPADEIAATVDQFVTSVQSASMRSLKTLLAQFVEKADDAITKLDVAPPKKQG